MAEQPINKNSSDEIDLGQLFQIIGRGFNKLEIAFLRLFLYLKKRALILGGLIVLGFGVGYGLNQISEEKKKIEVIVKPNLDSENYLYDVIEEIESNIKAKDTSFFNKIGVVVKDLTQFRISIEPVEVEKNRKADLELFEKFKDNPDFTGIIRSELLKNSTLNHRIIFTFKNVDEGQVFSRKVMEYINSNEFYQGLTKTSNQNAQIRIKQNEMLIEQVDVLVKNYTESIGEDKRQSLDNKIFLDNEKPLDITGLFQLKNRLTEDTEQKKIELYEQKEPINILNFGKPQHVIKSFFGRKLVLLPSIFLALFFTIEFIGFLNKKSGEINN